MQIEPDILSKTRNVILESANILIFSHRNPDPDTIGSNLAMKMFLKTLQKTSVSVCYDPVPPSCMFLPQAESITGTLNTQNVDLIITLDASSIDQLGFPDRIGKIIQKIPTLVIDHHATNNNYGDFNLIIPDAASTTLVLYHLFKAIFPAITADIATCLLCGLYSDTGSFMHSNTSEDSLKAAADLFIKGARKKQIIKNLYKSKSIEQLYLWGKIFSEAVITQKEILVSAVKKEDYEKLNTDQQSLTGVIDYLNMVKDSKITALLTEDGKGNIKGSLRTKRDDVDLTEIAKTLGGGGHTKASGFTLTGHLKKEIHWKIVT
jgi:phosphoesterase RecJ-like protein